MIVLDEDREGRLSVGRVVFPAPENRIAMSTTAGEITRIFQAGEAAARDRVIAVLRRRLELKLEPGWNTIQICGLEQLAEELVRAARG